MEEQHKEDTKTRPHRQRLKGGRANPKGVPRDKWRGGIEMEIGD